MSAKSSSIKKKKQPQKNKEPDESMSEMLYRMLSRKNWQGGLFLLGFALGLIASKVLL